MQNLSSTKLMFFSLPNNCVIYTVKARCLKKKNRRAVKLNRDHDTYDDSLFNGQEELLPIITFCEQNNLAEIIFEPRYFIP